MVISLRAAEKYVSSVFTKLGLPSTGNESRRVLAVLLYLTRPEASLRAIHQKTEPRTWVSARFPRPLLPATVNESVNPGEQ